MLNGQVADESYDIEYLTYTYPDIFVQNNEHSHPLLLSIAQSLVSFKLTLTTLELYNDYHTEKKNDIKAIGIAVDQLKLV